MKTQRHPSAIVRRWPRALSLHHLPPFLSLASVLLLTSPATAQHEDDFLRIEAADGWSVLWDGNDGTHFDPTSPDQGGAAVPDNLALASAGALPFGTSELDPAQWDFHVIPSLNDGIYGNANSWIGAGDDEEKFVGIDLGGQFVIGRVAWGRDNGNGAFDDSEAGSDACGGQCDDRWGGPEPYILQITTVPNPDADTPDAEWETIGTFHYLEMADIEPGEGFTPWLRHEYEIARTTGEATVATGIRLRVPSTGIGGGTAIDEIEIYGPAGDPRFFFSAVDEVSDRPQTQTLRVPIANRGATQTLAIDEVVLTGDPAFSLVSFPDSLEPLAQGELVIQFDPQGQVGRYLGEIAVRSNDEFFPEARIPLSVHVEHANGLVAWYPLDEIEGEIVTDVSGNRHHGRFVSSGDGSIAPAEALAAGNAVRVQGNLAYAEVPAEAGLPSLQTFSASLWVSFDAEGAGNFSSLISRGANLGNPFSVIASVGGPLQFFNAGLELPPTEAVITAGEPHHVVITHEDPNGPKTDGGAVVRLYLDGQLIFEETSSDGFVDDGSSPLQIGATAGQFGMAGVLDEVQIYKVPLTAEQVAFLHENPGETVPAGALGIRSQPGYVVSWDGNEGEHFDAVAPPQGSLVPDNLALPANGGQAFSSSDLGPELGVDFHAAHNLTDGFYGNAHSWISASEDPRPFIGVRLEGAVRVAAVAWSRDNGNGALDDSDPGGDACGGQCDDRALGVYTLQVTQAPSPDADTPDSEWVTVGTFDYRANEDGEIGGGFTAFLRHLYHLERERGAPLLATGVRLLVPAAGLNGGTAIDELEVYGQGTGPGVVGAAGFSLSWDGNEGDFFDAAAPPAGSLVPENAALATAGALAYTSSDLGPELGIDFHVALNVNDGFYGNANSWIHGSGDETPFLLIDLGALTEVTSVAWGRDNGNNENDCCGGQLRDRSTGLYTLQFTTEAGPDLNTPEEAWITLGTIDYTEVVGAFESYLRHEYRVATSEGNPVAATGLRLLVPPTGTAVDEFEVNPKRGPEPLISAEAGFQVAWDRSDGAFFDAQSPPDGALVPDNLALSAGGATAFSSGDLGPELGIDFHVASNVNDGFYGNAHSWIGASDAPQPAYIGVDLGGAFEIHTVAWSRDNGNGAIDDSTAGTDACGGQCDDRWAGVYVLQITQDPAPSAQSSWRTVAGIEYPAESADAVAGAGFTGFLRHGFRVAQADGSPITATGVRLIVPATGLGGGTAVDEIEVYGEAPPPPSGLEVTAAEGFQAGWDGNDGDFFDPGTPPDGALVPDNLALASRGGVAFASGELGVELGLDFHLATNLNDGFYGNANSWIGTGDGPFYAGVGLAGRYRLTGIAWGRDNGNGAADDSVPGSDACGGQCDDRWAGVYAVQITDAEDPLAAGVSWITVATMDYRTQGDALPGGSFTGHLRHAYTLSRAGGAPIEATGVRLVLPDGGIAIDELEVYGTDAGGGPTIVVEEGFSVAWDGNDGVHFDSAAPPAGARVPENLASLSQGGSAFSSSDLGPELGLDFHVAANLNDGFYGNGNSWISASGDGRPFVGVRFAEEKEISGIAWGRDNGNGAVDDSDPGGDACGGQCDDRSEGIYEVQITRATAPDASTPDTDWITVAQFHYTESLDREVGGAFTTYLRHEYQLMDAEGRPLRATGIRLLVPAAGLGGGTAIDELEVYQAMPAAPVPLIVREDDEVRLTWVGMPGARYYVEISESMESDDWVILPQADTLTPDADGRVSVTDLLTDARLRFYRVGTR